MTEAMIFIVWMIAIMMLLGFLLISVAKMTVKSDDEKINEKHKEDAELFLMTYESKDFAGRLSFVLLCGASFIGTILFGWINKQRGD